MYEHELKTTYDKLTDIKLNSEIEDWDVVSLVHKYRMFWKPQKIKTLLLAESHVFTETHLIKEEFDIPELIDYPKEYVRFVYCLAYGEDHLLENKQKKGTPQFWKLFNDCVKNSSREHQVLKMNNNNPKNRIEEKIALLEQMRTDSVWLMDCSITGIYDNGNKPPKDDYERILTTSFENYCLPIIDEESPEKIIVIGKAVYNLIISKVPEKDRVRYNWVHQPNARLKNENRRTLETLSSAP